MRHIRSMLFLALVLPLMAMAADRPAQLEPLPEAPPPPAGQDLNDADEPQVTIVKKGGDTVEEYRINGQLYMMKITPAHGVPYYMTLDDQEGGWTRMDGPAQPISIPKWVLFRF